MQVYLDYNSTAPPLAEVVECMARSSATEYANAASQHAAGRRARRIVEDAREAIAAILGADLSGRRPDRLIFTSGGTESNNLAILGLAGPSPGRLFVSAIEHPSVVGAAEHLASRGWVVGRLGADRNGVTIADELVVALRGNFPPAAVGDSTRRAEPTADCELKTASAQTLAAVMLGNNETGVLQPVAELGPVCRAFGALMHTDAVQVVGKLPVDFGQLGVATLAFSAHKFHGPRGIGGLIARGDVELSPLFHGGFQQGGLRPGTEPVALIAGMHKALEIWQRDYERRIRRMTALRDRFESALQAQLPDVVINGADAPRLPHTSNVSFRGLDRRALAMALDLQGVACSTGSACASGSSEPSPVLLAMGLPADVVAGSLRFSLGATTTEPEINEAIRRILSVCRREIERSRQAYQRVT